MNLKKIILIIISIILLLTLIVLGINIYNKKIEEKRIVQFETAAINYYNDNLSNIENIDLLYITLNMLRNSKNEYEIDYLKKCSSDSSIILEIKSNDIKIKKINIKCN